MAHVSRSTHPKGQCAGASAVDGVLRCRAARPDRSRARGTRLNDVLQTLRSCILVYHCSNATTVLYRVRNAISQTLQIGIQITTCVTLCGARR